MTTIGDVLAKTVIGNFWRHKMNNHEHKFLAKMVMTSHGDPVYWGQCECGEKDV